MRKVTIYTKTSTKRLKVKEGCYAVAIEYETKKGPAYKLMSGYEENTTYNRLALQSIICGLLSLKEPCEVTIYTDCVFVRNQINRESPEHWKRSEWIKSGGGNVKHKDLWQQFLAAKASNKIVVKPSEYKYYVQELDDLLQKCKEKYEKVTEKTKK